MTLAPLSLIIGGAASGKSAYAEALVLGAAQRPAYIATAEAFDDEMRAKIAAHRAARAAGPWTTIEAPRDLAGAISAAEADAILIDCATLWLSNLLLAEADIDSALAALFAALAACPCPVVIVTNEVGQGIVPEAALGRRFRALQGHANQRLAAEAGLVVNVIAGLPMVLKGALP